MIYPRQPLHGGGLGNIFKNILRTVTPFFKQFIKSDFAKNLRRIGSDQAMKFASDILQGDSIKRSAKKRAGETVERVKRGRGRPPKNEVPKKRGRPAKKEGGNQSKSRAGKKSRGRPPKGGKPTVQGRGKQKKVKRRGCRNNIFS